MKGFTHAGDGTEVACASDGWEITRASGDDGKADACIRDTGRWHDIRGEYGDARADGPEGSGRPEGNAPRPVVRRRRRTAGPEEWQGQAQPEFSVGGHLQGSGAPCADQGPQVRGECDAAFGAAAPTGGDQPLEAEAAKLQEAMAWGAQSAQQTRAQESGNDAGQSSAAAATRADTEEVSGRGGAGNAARPDVEVEPSHGDANDATRTKTGDDAGRGVAGDAAQPGAGGGGIGGDAQERPTSREEGETLAPGPSGAGGKGATVAAMAPTSPVVEETLVPEPTKAGDEGAGDRGASGGVAAE
ncbi:uncharacterized PE-PGRS family protein PE_PGRS54-like [Panicum virgatum]|uniref:uncharacterized PE-PGRS family protein PE_PGRS54-like n=1 Tax=Panicum virgatum TaxID=38727 RepID=UPI0019D5E6AF|nr:uncharacterized PE-PGRS family protein PE_PGRS54-like [Panicum virgatum]